jgi:beta-carotene 15,15'-dioxygenase
MIRSISASSPPGLRLWALPILTFCLVLLNQTWQGLDSATVTAMAALAILIAGIPHGTLDVEIAATRFGRSDRFSKLMITAAYIGCAGLMLALWSSRPEIALIAFLVISIFHFGADWRGIVDPFLAAMVGWALIALPALSHPQQVAAIFDMLTGNQNGSIIAALLACTSVPATLGTLVFAYGVYQKGDLQFAINVVSCIIAALLLPPLIAFSIFFCCLHSPRHMAEAIAEAGALSLTKKVLIIIVVFSLSIGLGVLFFVQQDNAVMDVGIIRTAFVLLSTLTVPHFLLEQIMARQSKSSTLA